MLISSPQPGRAIAARGGEGGTVGAERHPEHVAGEGAGGLAGGDVLQPGRPVMAGSSQESPSRPGRLLWRGIHRVRSSQASMDPERTQKPVYALAGVGVKPR